MFCDQFVTTREKINDIENVRHHDKKVEGKFYDARG